MRLALALALLAVFPSVTASAQEFEVPPGFVILAEPDTTDDGLDAILTVRPESGAFAGLSAIRLSHVKDPVADPDAWLTGRLSADVGDGAELDDLFASPDSPFADPAFDTLRRALPDLFAKLNTLGTLPLEFCDEPRTGYNAAGAYRELYCVFELGPTRQYLVQRIQRSADRWYATEIRTMNERRLRHLLAIADTFTTGVL